MASIWIRGYEIPLSGLLLVLGAVTFAVLFGFMFWGKTRKKTASAVETASSSE